MRRGHVCVACGNRTCASFVLGIASHCTFLDSAVFWWFFYLFNSFSHNRGSLIPEGIAHGKSKTCNVPQVSSAISRGVGAPQSLVGPDRAGRTSERVWHTQRNSEIEDEASSKHLRLKPVSLRFIHVTSFLVIRGPIEPTRARSATQNIHQQ